ncbi:hypothetical protein K443DRAFT_15605 [Laccaria amethystina LaAM-08-1]|uniref:Uncharacterized protein n=1 Tax=Laccaria amethystina LaAM-08-1 TaxID=1095629 RepID=A0A0C9WXD4_9AGAR|nr:hypothetical protein K443DRAFT_15605 [Laccaria amethystina LaAM-08-1]
MQTTTTPTWQRHVTSPSRSMITCRRDHDTPPPSYDPKTTAYVRRQPPSPDNDTPAYENDTPAYENSRPYMETTHPRTKMNTAAHIRQRTPTYEDDHPHMRTTERRTAFVVRR